MKITSIVLRMLLALAALLLPGRAWADPPTKFDVNDVAFMFPAPTTEEDAKALISGDELLADGKTTVWPREFFDQVMQFATTRPETVIGGSVIGFPKGVEDLHNWKVAGIRVNPASLGGSPEMLQALQAMIAAKKVPIAQPIVFGIRLVMQPVLVSNGTVDVKDFAAHVVFNLPEIAITDDFAANEDVKAIVGDLVEIKAMVKTDGEKLGVHPGLAQKVAGFNERLHAFLKARLTREHFDVVSFMGLKANAPEPWIFFRVQPDHTTDKMMPTPIGGFPVPPGTPSEMLVFRGKVQPTPVIADGPLLPGVNTSVLFESGFNPSDDLLPTATGPLKGVKKQDVADFVANPNRSNTLNTDCVSCHTETTRRLTLGLQSAPGIGFVQPAGISAVDGDKVFPPKTPQTSPASWNVRVFGWGPSGAFWRQTVCPDHRATRGQ